MSALAFSSSASARNKFQASARRQLSKAPINISELPSLVPNRKCCSWSPLRVVGA